MKIETKTRIMAPGHHLPFEVVSLWCCRAAARLALTRPASTKHWRRRTFTPTGSPEFPSQRLIRSPSRRAAGAIPES